jgi:Thermostable hemolysin
MREPIVLGGGHPLRDQAEGFIRRLYAAAYGADIKKFPSRIIASLDHLDRINCAAGIRSKDDGFFSESYLNTPVEEALSRFAEREVSREQIFEVTTLASHAHRTTLRFIDAIGKFGEGNGFDWSFFTLTRRLALLVGRLGHPMIYLADADQRRIPDHHLWGTYYASEPKVFAIQSPTVVPGSRNPGERTMNAPSL